MVAGQLTSTLNYVQPIGMRIFWICEICWHTEKSGWQIHRAFIILEAALHNI